MNQLVLVGRLTNITEIQETENGEKNCEITLAVSRNYKNADGVYETDYINCKVWRNIAGSVTEYCKVGDILGIKGRLQSLPSEEKDNSNLQLGVVAERITFLSNQKTNDSKKNNDLER